MRVLESERLLLKPVEEEDILQLLELRWDADVMEHLVHDPISPSKQRAWFQSLSDRDLALSIFAKEGGTRRIIGTMGLYNINPRHQLATWRIRFNPEVQGKGFGYEASSMMLEYGFNTLNLHRIVSTSFADNAAIIRLLEKLGCRNEGLFRQHFYSHGRFRDVVTFGLLKDDFFSAREKAGK
jgi:RimJ/RimL family protein N-acetyltransferase